MTKLPNEPLVKEILATALNLPHDAIGPETSIVTVEKWDSLSHLNIIMALEQTFDLKFKSREIPLLTSYEAILKALRDK